jgi:phosphoribosylformimino-5-aminoimidazole carboxamide ribotide isomerase
VNPLAGAQQHFQQAQAVGRSARSGQRDNEISRGHGAAHSPSDVHTHIYIAAVSVSRPRPVEVMQILPVIDLMGGVVVRGVAGQRHLYRPLVSKICAGAEPLAVAAALRERFGFTELYIADLDAIAGEPPATDLYWEMAGQGFQLWVDAGLRTADDAVPLIDASVTRVIAGSETLAGPEVLAQLYERFGAENIVFSLDLNNGQPLSHGAWRGDRAWKIALVAIHFGVRSIIVLDLARVGVNDGIGLSTQGFCGLLAEDSKLEVITGGGIRGVEDLGLLEAIGVKRALVASALHDGRIAPGDIKEWVARET